MREVFEKVIFIGYQGLRSLRYTVLVGVFGYVSHCKHQEACGTYFFRQLREHGIVVGLLKGMWRVIRCW